MLVYTLKTLLNGYTVILQKEFIGDALEEVCD